MPTELLFSCQCTKSRSPINLARALVVYRLAGTVTLFLGQPDYIIRDLAELPDVVENS
jgi:hypothetical protein